MKVSEGTVTRGSVLWAPQVLMAGSLGSLRGEVPGALLDVLGFWPRWLDCMSVGRHVGAGEIQVLVRVWSSSSVVPRPV